MLWWFLFGATVGALAAQKKGFSPIVGVAVGALLGALSPLLFAVSGLTSAGDLDSRKCSHCAERVKAEAKVCKHCGRDLAPATVRAAETSGSPRSPADSQRPSV